MRETGLYPPIKAFLEAQGYTVKGRSTGATWLRSGGRSRR